MFHGEQGWKARVEAPQNYDKIKLTDDIRKYANDQVTIKNFGQRSAGFNGSREKQYTGVLGECIIYESLDRALPTYNDGSLIEDFGY